MAIVISGYAKGLALKVYNPGTKAIFPVTSTIVYGKKDAVLIDAQFQKQYAEELVKQIKGLKKNLKYVFVSYHDPDYYFGLDVIHKAFPEAQIISTAQTAYLIEASKDFKLNVWKDQLGADAPDTLLVPQPVDSLPSIEGNTLQIKYNSDDTAHPFVWIPSLRAIKVDFGAFAFRNSFKDAHHMTFLGLNGGYKGVTDSVLPTVVEVSSNVFMVYWSEPNSTKSNVAHVQNYNTGTVWTNIAAPDDHFYNMQGKMSVVE